MNTLRFIARAVVILLLLVGALLRYLVGWTLKLAALRGREARKAWFGQCLVDLFRSLGATFIKVGQIMSTRPDLFPPHVIHALERLQDDVGPFEFHHVRRILV